MYEALVARVRYHIQKANFTGLKEADSKLLLADAADAMEELQQQVEHYHGCMDDWFEAAQEYKSAVPKWIPMTERLPEKFENVIVANKCGKHYDIDKAWWNGYCFDRCAKGPYQNVTHWMPLPEPPKEDKRQEPT